ncbi:MAG: hypothetical protein A2057_00340 [Ignavibacteria bacterium GWA2_35_9]|nr:MAG: hypothetical protein A2057_00340 [Ignavibacteria bacterium GWA2_35_9]OGU45720.1 MAG: hypothetical protein A2000_05065 [Ignavibacteria bacterium GWB2_36_8]OGU50171.1 MAG: hypothetical protein A2080_13800 [Ignavibacteria bacterium GWC2_36_12]
MNTANLVEEINVFSEQKLKRKNDLKILLEMSFKNEKSVLLENLSFTAKYIRGLERVLKKGSMNPEISNIEQIKQDYTNNIKKSIDQIKELISFADTEVNSYFEEKYFKLTQEGFQSLSELLEDLEWTKMYFNRQKRRTTN